MLYGDFQTKHISGHDLTEARAEARLSIDQAAELCGVNRTTLQRQENNGSRASLAFYRLLLMHAGWLPPPFEGWKITKTGITSPEHRHIEYEPGEILSLPLLHAQIADMARAMGRDYLGKPEYVGDGTVVPIHHRRHRAD